MIPRAVPIAALTLAASAARSQFTPDTTATFSLDFSDIGGVPNGVLEPGESALLRLSVSFTNQNSIATVSPPFFGTGAIRGFAVGLLDIVGTPTLAASGTWNLDAVPGYGIRFPWDLFGPESWGSPSFSGAAISAIQFAQFPRSAASIMTENPISSVWQALWTPSNYSPRTVTFTPREIPEYSAGVWLQTGDGGTQLAWCGTQLAAISIPIIPAPGTTPLLAALLLARRRRHPETSA